MTIDPSGLPPRRRRVLAFGVAAVGLGVGAASLASVPVAQAQVVRYVDDAVGCEGQRPCYPSIQAAVDAAAGGDVISVAPGRYEETVVVVDKAVVIQGPGAGDSAAAADPSLHAVWVARDAGAPGAALTVDARTADVRGLRLEGLRIVSGTFGVRLVGRRLDDPVPPPPDRPTTTVRTRVVDARIADVHFDACGAPGAGAALLALWSEGLVVEHSRVRAGGSGIVLRGGEDLAVRDNVFERPGGPAVRAQLLGARIEIARNRVTAPAGRGIDLIDLDMPGAGATDVLVADNTVSSARDEGIHVAVEHGGTLDDVRLMGNLVVAAGSGGAAYGGLALRAIDGRLGTVRVVGGQARDTRRAPDPGAPPAAGIYAELVGGLWITDTALTGADGPGLALVDARLVRLRRSALAGNAVGVRVAEALAAEAGASAALPADIVLGGAPDLGNALAGNRQAAVVLANETGTSVSTADVVATYNDWGTAYAPAIEDQVVHRPDDSRLGVVSYLPALRVPESVTVAAAPPRLVADGASRAALTATVVDAAGAAVADGTLVVFAADRGALDRPGRLVEAEDGALARSGEWGVFDSTVFGPFSGLGYLRSRQVGAALAWTFDSEAVLVRYGQSILNTGTVAATIDGVDRGDFTTLGPDKVWVERVLATGLGPGPHTLTLTLETGEVNLDLLAAGAATAGGRAAGGLRADEALGVARVTAAARGAAGTRASEVSVPFTAGAPAALVLRFGAAAIPVGGVTTTVTVEVHDDRGRPVPDGTEVRLSTDLGRLVPALAQTVAGRARATLTSETTLGTATVRAESGAVSVTRRIELVAGAPATLALLPSRSTLPANSVTFADLQVTVRDAWGHPVADGTPVALASDLGTFTANSVTTTRGVAVARLTVGAVAGLSQVRATAGAATDQVTLTLTGLDLRVTKAVEPRSVVVPGEMVTFTLVYANVGVGTVYDLEIRDPIPDALETITLLTSAPWLTQLSGPPYSWVVERLRPGESAEITIGTRVDTKRRWPPRTTLTNRVTVGSAKAAELTPADNAAAVDVVVVPAAVYTVTVRAPGQLVVGGATGRVTATVTDRFGNSAGDGTAVFFSADLGTVAPSVATTRNGLAETTFTTGTRAGRATVRAVSLEERGGAVTVRVLPGPADSLTLVSERPGLAVGNDTTVLTATLTDEHDNRIADAEVTFATSLGFLSATTGRTDAEGAVTTTLHSGVRTGLARVQARGAFLTRELVIPFAAGPVARLDLALFPPRIPVGGRAQVTARLVDEFDNAAPGVVVAFQTTLGTMRSDTVVTDARGEALTYVSSDRTGSGVVRASAAGRGAVAAFTVDRAVIHLPFSLKR